jgi:glycosyltransferase involved in cell wall biosynthesis
MPTITALVHTENDARRLGRCLETLYACDEILIVDHNSSDNTIRLARQYGARIVSGADPHALPVRTQWVLSLAPRESITEGLAASLYECKSGSVQMKGNETFSFLLREENEAGWIEGTTAQTRLVPAGWNHWHQRLPINHEASHLLQGEILRFAFP